MADKKHDPRNVVTSDRVRLSFAHLFKPRPSTDDDGKVIEGSERYSTMLLIDKNDKVTLDALEKAEAAVKADPASLAVWKTPKVPNQLRSNLRDGDTRDDVDEREEYRGHMFMNTSSKQKPGVVNRRVEEVTDPSDVYSGCYVRVSLRAYPYNQKGNKGISFGLNHVQKVRDGEPLGGMTRATDVFDALGDEYEDDGDGNELI